MADLLNPIDAVPSTAPAPDASPPPGAIPVEQFQSEEDAYDTPVQQAKAIVEGLGKGLAGALFTKGEKLLGVNPKEVEKRAEAHPIFHYGAEAVGLIAPAIISGGVSAEARAGLEAAELAPEAISTASKLAEFTQAGMLGRAGTAAAEALGLKGAAATAVKLGTENALLAAGDELSKSINNNPDTIQTAAINVGLSGLLGVGAGYGLGKVSELWKAKVGPEADKFVQDFQSRLQAHASDTIPTADAVHTELAQEFANVNDAIEGLRGAGGLKAQDIGKLLPLELDPKMYEQAADVLSKAKTVLDKAAAEPGIYTGARFSALNDYANRLESTLAEKELSPQKIFTALDDFKKGIGDLKKWSPFSPEIEKPGAALVGDLYHTVRTGLEDSSIWEKAGERQAAINKLFTDHIPASNDFQRAFTEKVGGDSVVSPGKVQTLINGLGKPNAEIKLEKLANYLHANDTLYDELGKIHANLGIENPFQRPGLANTRAILNDITPGMKAADFVRLNALNIASEGAAGAAGGALGHLTGIPGAGYIGSIFGHYAFKPLMRTIMPSLIRPIMQAGVSGEGLRAAFDGVGAVIRGESMANMAAKALFQTGMQATLNDLNPPKYKLDKLQEKVSEASPSNMLSNPSALGHYLPQHASAASSTAQNALNYLQQNQPKPTKNGILDREIPPNASQVAAYKQTLAIAEQPLLVFSKIKAGTLTGKDVLDLKNLYPALYPRLVQKVTEQMTEHLAKQDSVPLRMRMGLSVFMGQPIDSTFTPNAMMAAQMTYLPKPPPPGMAKAPKSTAKLTKSAELARTPSESRMATLSKK